MSDEKRPPKIIVDDNWKERVQAEKEALRGDKAETGPDQAAAAANAASDAGEAIPPASFPMLVTSLATQALYAMGQIPDPETNQPVLRPDLAKHHIDMLAVLEEKTQGNLDADESRMLSAALHELRMAFIAVQAQA